MTEPPADAQYSDDGHWWWDATTNEWKPVAAAGAAAAAPAAGQGGAGADAGQGDAGTCMLSFAGTDGTIAQLGVSDEADDPVPAADRDTKVSVSVFNVGHVACGGTVTVTVDGTEVAHWDIDPIQPGGVAQPPDGFIHNCGAHPAGSHEYKAVVNPGTGHPQWDEVVNTVSF